MDGAKKFLVFFAKSGCIFFLNDYNNNYRVTRASVRILSFPASAGKGSPRRSVIYALREVDGLRV